MDWVQIFNYYASRTNNVLPSFRSYCGELARRISKQMGANKKDADTLSDLNDFIATHSADIGAGLAVNRQIRVLPHDPFLEVDRRFALPKAGFADFIVSLRTDGSVDGVWSLDGTPDFQLAYALKAQTEKLRTPPTEITGVTYAWFAEALDDVQCPSCVNAYKRTKH